MKPEGEPYDVACPSCGAKAGQWCKRPSGHSGPFVAPHAYRVELARKTATGPELDDVVMVDGRKYRVLDVGPEDVSLRLSFSKTVDLVVPGEQLHYEPRPEVWRRLVP